MLVASTGFDRTLNADFENPNGDVQCRFQLVGCDAELGTRSFVVAVTSNHRLNVTQSGLCGAEPL